MAAPAAAQAQTIDHSDIRYGSNILKVSEAEQVAYIESALNKGLLDDDVAMLVLNRSALTLPLIEKKIEEVLASPNPASCFTVKGVDPARFVGIAARMIDYAGNKEALEQLAKLMAIDENRFGELVWLTLINNENRRDPNPFTLAYAGLEIDSAPLRRRIIAWAESELPGKTDSRKRHLKEWWAEAMLSRHGRRLPTEQEWNDDPLASRIFPPLAKLMHDDVFRSMNELIDQRGKEPPAIVR
jgi:hypothetical protein